MLAKLAMQLLSLNFVDAKLCGTAHAQLKTSTHGQKNYCTICITLPWTSLLLEKLAANQDHHSVGEMQVKMDKYVL